MNLSNLTIRYNETVYHNDMSRSMFYTIKGYYLNLFTSIITIVGIIILMILLKKKVLYALKYFFPYGVTFGFGKVMFENEFYDILLLVLMFIVFNLAFFGLAVKVN